MDLPMEMRDCPRLVPDASYRATWGLLRSHASSALVRRPTTTKAAGSKEVPKAGATGVEASFGTPSRSGERGGLARPRHRTV